jgi:dTDP-4-amino-4,6-dideoxygalactose transaminase
MAAVDELRAGLAGRDIAIVEDAAQSQGATRHGHGAGSAGLGGEHAIASTSFYPGKNLGAYGDAGAVVTEDADLERTVRMLSNHGGLVKYVHEIVGVNSRLDGLQAVVLRAKLARLAGWNAARRAAAARYDELLDGVDVVRPVTLAGNEHVWHLYVVRAASLDGTASRRDEIVKSLNSAGVGAAIHYPFPLHQTPAFSDAGFARGAFPHAEAGATEILSLPLYPQITEDQQAAVVDALRKAL